QITDITVGLATGQAPMMVFLQQGGQLKDIFGGVGPALRAVGGYIAGLITPLTLAGAALAAFGLAAYKGSQESQALRESLILSGNAIGQSADGLAEMAQRMAAIDGTVGRASATLAAFARSARIPAEALEESARAAQTWARATGQSVQEVIDEFNEIGRDPVDALMRLNEQYNFLDAATLQRIQ